MNERDTTLINDYFNGLLSPSDAQQVQDRATTDPEFGREFLLHQEMALYPRRAAQRLILTDTLQEIGPDFFREEKESEELDLQPEMTVKVNWIRWVAAAACIALVATAYWFFSQPITPEYQHYAQHAPLSLTVRGTADVAKSEAEKAFNNKNYAGALSALDQILSADTVDITAMHFKGICLLELDRPADARAVWMPISNGSSALRSEAEWYIALSYLKEKNNAACKTALQNIAPEADRYQKAQTLLKDLK